MASTQIVYDLTDSDGSPWPSDSSMVESDQENIVPAQAQNPYRFEPVRDSSSSSSSDGNRSESDEGDGRRHNTAWCECNHCSVMPTVRESLCCQEVLQYRDKCRAGDPTVCCLTLHSSFEAVCLNTDVLDTAYFQFRQQYKTDDSNKRPDERYRHIAYRQVVRWCYGWLGRDVRRIIPSCIVSEIRKRFPSPTEEYEGFKYKI